MTPKPQLRTQAKQDLHAALHGAVAGSIGAMFNTSNYPFRSCINCSAFDEVNEYCRRWKSKPPARIIVFSCDSHSEALDENIPF